MNKYKINLHAHSIFSDGYSSPYVMALKAKELGFTALVITDHWYGRVESSLTAERLVTLRAATNEASEVLPVIVGLEIPHGGNEFLVFGGDAIKKIVSHGNERISTSDMWDIRRSTNSVFILCHPRMNISYETTLLIDGFEAYNSGRNLFERRGYGALRRLPAWSNSDADTVNHLPEGWNEIDTKITTEEDLIKYIKSGKQPDMFVKGEKVTG